MGSETFTVKTEVFEGPLELLLSLIEKRKLFINDISLAAVADDYIAYLQHHPTLPVRDTADFILIASTLVLIKSKSLLPSLELTDEENADIENLEARLKEYKRIKELSRHIRERFGKHIMFRRQAPASHTPVFSPDKHITAAAMLAAAQSVVAGFPKEERLAETVVKKVVSLEEVIDNLSERVRRSLSVSFREFVGFDKKDKVEVVVGFLAMLELVKQGVVNVVQRRQFDDISIESARVDTPEYL